MLQLTISSENKVSEQSWHLHAENKSAKKYWLANTTLARHRKGKHAMNKLSVSSNTRSIKTWTVDVDSGQWKCQSVSTLYSTEQERRNGWNCRPWLRQTWALGYKQHKKISNSSILPPGEQHLLPVRATHDDWNALQDSRAAWNKLIERIRRLCAMPTTNTGCDERSSLFYAIRFAR